MRLTTNDILPILEMYHIIDRDLKLTRDVHVERLFRSDRVNAILLFNIPKLSSSELNDEMVNKERYLHGAVRRPADQLAL